MNSIIENNINLSERFIDINSARELTNINVAKLRKIIKELDITTKTIIDNGTTKKMYSKLELEKFKNEMDSFWNNHMIFSSVEDIYGKKISKIVTKIEVPPIYRKTSAKYVVLIEEAEKVKNSLQNDYYSYNQVIEILNLNKDNLTQVIKDFNLTKERLPNNDTGFLKNEIDDIKQKQEDFLRNALTYDYVYNTYGASYTLNIESHELPYYARCISVFNNRSSYYKKEEIQLYLKNKTKKEQSLNIQSETLFDTYTERLTATGFEGFNNRPYSSNKWNNFVSEKLAKTNSSDETKNRNINKYVKSCEYLFNFLDSIRPDKSIEVYSLSTKQINFFLNTLPKLYEKVIYRFLKVVAQDIHLKKISSRPKGFDFRKIKSPFIKENSDRDNIEDMEEEIYPFKEYMELVRFLVNIELHLNRLSNIEDSFERIRYLSLWLYTSIQLTNTWRRGDVCTFPKINWENILIEEKIFSIDWFYHNKISQEVARKVITTLREHNYFISKTNKKHKFRASDDVGKTLATILFLLDLSYKDESIIDPYKDNIIMNFGTKYNKPGQYLVDKFFEGFVINNFKFRNKKMTNSILSYSKAISPAEYGILIPKNQRSHDNIKSTYHYVKHPKEHLDFLSHQLFERGEFGHLYDALVDIVAGDKSKATYLQERTKLIKSIKHNFGDIQKIEASLRLSIYYTETDVIDKLYNEKLDKCVAKLNDVHLKRLPSKEPHIQCILGKSMCKHPERSTYPKGDGCIGCEYSIPNIYAINVLAYRLKKDFKDYISTTNQIIKRKLSMRIYKYKQVLNQAKEKFGTEYIYSCIGVDINREEFLYYLRKINSPSELNKNTIERLLGGNDNYVK